MIVFGILAILVGIFFTLWGIIGLIAVYGNSDSEATRSEELLLYAFVGLGQILTTFAAIYTYDWIF